MDRQNAAIRAKERARLSLEIKSYEFGRLPVVNYELTCHGTTPAYVIENWESVTLNPAPDYPWPKTAFGFPLRDLPSVVAPGKISSEIFIMGTDRSMSAEDTKAAVERGSLFLHFRVRLRYKDIFETEHTLVENRVYGVPHPHKSYDRSQGSYLMLASGARPSQWWQSEYQYGSENTEAD